MNKLSLNFDSYDARDCENMLIANDNQKEGYGIDLAMGALSSFVKIERTVISNLDNTKSDYSVNGDVLIENVNNSTINLNGKVGALRIKAVKNSQIIISGICNGSVYVEEVVGGKLVVAGDQIRIHCSSNVDIFLLTKSSCILEDCEDLRFHPNRLAAGLLDLLSTDSYWKSVHDFGFNSETSFELIDSNE